MAKFSSKTMILLSLVCFFAMSFCSAANSYVGVGIHTQLQQAKKLALVDLQYNLFVTIDSVSHLKRQSHGPNYYRSDSQLSSQLPLISVESSCQMLNQEHHCQALLDNTKAVHYQQHLEAQYKEVQQLWQTQHKLSGAKKYQTLQQLLVLLEEIKPIERVLLLLNDAGEKQNLKLKGATVSVEEITHALHQMQQQPANIEELAIAIAQQYKQFERVYIKPFAQQDSQVISPFAKALHNELLKHIDATSNKDYAFYELLGEYQVVAQQVFINSQLLHITRESKYQIASASSHKMALAPLTQYAIVSPTITFDKELEAEKLQSDTLQAQIRTNKGQRQLLFSQGEEITLEIKLSQPGYYFLVGHQLDTTPTQSYLLDLNEKRGAEKFIGYVTPSQANRWQNLGSFVVNAPFGAESLQLFAFTQSPVDVLPESTLVNGYYQLPIQLDKVLGKTRGLIRKNRSPTQITKTPEMVESQAVNKQIVASLDTPKELNSTNVAASKRPLKHQLNNVSEATLTFTTKKVN